MADYAETIKQIWLRHLRAHFNRNDDYMTEEMPLKPILNYFVE